MKKLNSQQIQDLIKPNTQAETEKDLRNLRFWLGLGAIFLIVGMLLISKLSVIK